MKCAKCGRELKNPKSRELFGSSKQFQHKTRSVSPERHSHCEISGQISLNDYLQSILME